MMTKKRSREILANWSTLTATLGSLNEEECWLLLCVEMSTKKRRSFLERIHQAYSDRRRIRERQEILKGAA